MKNILISIFFISFLLSCHKNSTIKEDVVNATIIGFAGEKCACCWGYKIKLDDAVFIPAMYLTREFYLAEAFPLGFELPQNTVYPIRVKLDWEFDNSKCAYTYIKIKSISIPMKGVKN